MMPAIPKKRKSFCRWPEFLGSLVDLDEKGQIKIDPGTNRTKTEGLFAAGDVTDAKYKQVVIAAGQGAAAALSADAYLRRR